MIKAQFENLLVNNDATNDEYLRHFGFTVEDLSYLISPQSSLSPIKKKQRNVFNFEAFGEETEGGAEGREDSPVALDAALDEFPLDAALDEFPLEGLDQGQGMQGIQGMQEPFAGPDMHLMQLGLQQGLQGLQGQQGQRQLGLGQSAPKVTTSIRSGPRSSAASVSALASCAPTSLSIAPIFAPAPSTSAPTAPVSDSLSPMARGDSAGMFSLCSLTSFDLDEGEVAVGAAKEWDEREGEGAGGVQATMDHFPTTGTVGMDQTAYQMQMQMMQGQMMQGQMQLQMMSQLQNMGNMGNMGNTNMGNMGSMGTDNFGMGTIGNVGNGYPGFNQFYVPPIPGIGYPPDSASVISASTQDSRGSSQSHTSHASHTHSNASHYGSQGSPLYSQGSPMYSGSASEPSSHTHTPIAQGGFVFPHVKQERGMGMGMGVGMGVGMGGGMGIGMSGMGMGMGSIPESGGASGARAFASASAPAPSAPTSAPTSATSAPTSTAPAKDDSSRAAKSLATISRRFVERFGEPSTISYISGQLGVDDLRSKKMLCFLCSFFVH
ncbi:hypothetical protein B484DRAFT_144968 [Ochromonadaceae sp. CCMP2298]|nr:hypothetical protein B484DRAFT_144968 [Ochromonadaceae sp. CCMP2298]